ncbi:MAG: hypothetical protein QOF48_2434 [Verrucomicrobiota bacterium]
MRIFRIINSGLIAALTATAAVRADGVFDVAVRGQATAATGHWGFVAPVLPVPPRVKNIRWIRNPIDRFVLERLERDGVDPSPEADRPALLRRLCLDLTGLPPTPDQARTFLSDHRDGAYERLVDELLASPHFGERWGRHWLDLARYADTSGYQIDRVRPHAWLYRDWVIDSFNRDEPFDQFTLEQIAGDLLPQESQTKKLEPLIAAGLHRLTLMNHEDGVDAEEFRCKARVDRVDTTATVWLGLTIGCAECHNHKFDPISQREFYQLYAFFNNADEVDIPAPRPDDPARQEKERKQWDEAEAQLRAAFDSQRTNETRRAELKKQLARHRRSQPRPHDTAIMSFRESTNAPRARIHVRGDFLRPGDDVLAGTPAILHPLVPRGTRGADRLDLARWLVDPANPLTARVAVNQTWLHLFGRGLVSTSNDFGKRGEPPSHPALLDWLAVLFMTSTNASSMGPAPLPSLAWSRKSLIRLIVNSATYRQSSRLRPDLAETDPFNILLARQGRFRVESEIIRDLQLSCAGLLNEDVGGAPFRPFMPDDIRKLGTAGAFSWDNSTGSDLYRRGLYIFSQRTVPYPTAMTFDQADSCESCPQRERSTTPLQALTLMNHGLFAECARSLARRITAFPGRGPREKIGAAFQLCLSRSPSRGELNRLGQLFADELAASPAPSCSAAQEKAYAQIAQVLLNLDEFLTRE